MFRECSLGIAYKDGVVDCSGAATRRTIFKMKYACLLSCRFFVYFLMVATTRSIPTHRIVDPTTIPKENLPQTSLESKCRVELLDVTFAWVEERTISFAVCGSK